MHQTGLSHGEYLPLRIAYQQLFKNLPTLPAQEDSRGRPQISRDALLRALVYRALRRFTTLSDLVHALNENPALLEAIGLDPVGPVPASLLSNIALPVKAVYADSAYDSEAVLKIIVDQLHAQPIVARHPRHQSNPEFRVQGPVVVCTANLEMFRRGKMPIGKINTRF